MKDIGIFDLIQLSRQGPRYYKEMLISVIWKEMLILLV